MLAMGWVVEYPVGVRRRGSHRGKLPCVFATNGALAGGEAGRATVFGKAREQERVRVARGR